MKMPILLLVLSLLLCVAIFVFAVPLAFRMWSAQSFLNPVPEAEQTHHGDVRQELRDYVIEFLRRYPNVNTYLGGSSLASELREVDGELRDHSAGALEKEDRWLSSSLQSFEELDPSNLSSDLCIDREVALAQIRFMLHLHQVRHYQERAVDTYTDEPFKAVDLVLQNMTIDEKGFGTPEEWSLLVRRVQAIPGFLTVAEEQLSAGVKSGRFPDWRLLRRNGLQITETNAKYFAETLPALAAEHMSAQDRGERLEQLRVTSLLAADAFRRFREFIAKTFFDNASSNGEAGVKPQFRGDRYALGEAEYAWALKNNFRIRKTPSELYDEFGPIVESTRREMFKLAREIGAKAGLALPADDAGAVRAVMDQLSKEYPKSDTEMIAWYRSTAFRLVEYGRRTGMFDVPSNYKLDVLETPLPLRGSLSNASYNAAPPFKNTGVGRFYLSPTGNNDAALRANNRSAIAVLAAHEGFPGHDWHFKLMTLNRDQISPVRWLTPGAVDDSSAMWQDAMAAEGWGLYAEALMAEPQKGAPDGFYTPEEKLYQLRAKLQRELRVRIDIGLHTGRMKWSEAVNVYSEMLDFLPGTCGEEMADSSPDKKASCGAAEKQVFRYAKWPTQAVTYALGKAEIVSLRAEAARLEGDRFSPEEFHLLLMKQGTIPVGTFRDVFVSQVQAKANPPAPPPKFRE